MDVSDLRKEPTLIGQLQRRCAAGVSIALLVAGLLMTPFANLPLAPLPGYMTAFGAAMLVINFMLAVLLFGRGATEGDGVLVMLGTAYFFVGTIFVPLMAAFPGGLTAGSLIGTPVSSVWLWSFWHAGFGLLVLRSAQAALRGERRGRSTVREVLVTVAVVALLASVATLGLPYLPSLFVDGHRFFSGGAKAIPYAILLIDAAAAVLLLRLKRKTPEQLWLAVGMLAACFDVWLTFHGTDRFSLGWYVSKLGSLFTSMAVLVSLFADLNILYKRAYQANVLLSTLAHQDGLTRLANRRRFDEALEVEWRRAKRFGEPISLMMIDVDFFKKFNDRFGHLGGDDCLRKVAGVLKDCAQRPGDTVARYGGEEFALVLPATSAGNALDLAMKIRERLAALAIPHPDMPLGRVSVSIGISTIIPGVRDMADVAVHGADTALYAAKNGGRDCALHADGGAVAA